MKDFIKSGVPVLPSSDVAGSLEYYKTKLGFDKTWVHQGFYGGAYNGNAEFHFYKVEGEIHPGSVYCFVENVDEVFDFIKQNGVNINNEPKDQDYGLRDFSIKDLDGNTIGFASEIKK